jgi:hypothetical protein
VVALDGHKHTPDFCSTLAKAIIALSASGLLTSLLYIEVFFNFEMKAFSLFGIEAGGGVGVIEKSRHDTGLYARALRMVWRRVSGIRTCRAWYIIVEVVVGRESYIHEIVRTSLPLDFAVCRGPRHMRLYLSSKIADFWQIRTDQIRACSYA